MRKVVGKRLTYAELIGKVETEAGPYEGTKESSVLTGKDAGRRNPKTPYLSQPQQNRTYSIQIRVDLEEKNAIKESAQKSMQSMSDWIKARIFGRTF